MKVSGNYTVNFYQFFEVRKYGFDCFFRHYILLQ